ncbi:MULTISPECIES: Hcp family type VI secretion system effector [Burkholderia]|uniref:Type VI secretion system effector, Hcp1 family n=1 Tax=Burkholderia anthina TaxID=179879 RepID=A0A6P2GCU3_9BURK|nr:MULTISPECIES: type VI secretion system tube protein Hcp [Burkholderia]AXK61802.1 Hcp1 family type VI secretion system effector [Burkholderia sp. IDO3]MBM2768264.1 type VI secretion system tube protein Hcp [Burkholderia anthina]PCD62949.1 type VI secretion system tube protein Hcp [Burkholderia sp. IDO3]VVU51592.1 type VI secretion system effector, Hcp1 family [Burkholderia anthina]
MAADAFIKINGIIGESQDSEHKDDIEVMDWKWSMSQQSNMHAGTGGGAGRAKIDDLIFVHHIDRATPNLAVKCASGEHIDQATLYVRRAGKDAQEYVKIKMTDVVITSVNMLGKRESNGRYEDDRLAEEVRLSFAKFEYEYTPQSQSGASAAAITRSYDIKANKANS